MWKVNWSTGHERETKKTRVPDRNQTHDLPNNRWAFYPLSYENSLFRTSQSCICFLSSDAIHELYFLSNVIKSLPSCVFFFWLKYHKSYKENTHYKPFEPEQNRLEVPTLSSYPLKGMKGTPTRPFHVGVPPPLMALHTPAIDAAKYSGSLTGLKPATNRNATYVKNIWYLFQFNSYCDCELVRRPSKQISHELRIEFSGLCPMVNRARICFRVTCMQPNVFRYQFKI